MATAWETLLNNSSLQSGTAWELLNNQAQTGGNAVPPTWLLIAEFGAFEAVADIVDVLAADTVFEVLEATALDPSSAATDQYNTTTENV